MIEFDWKKTTWLFWLNFCILQWFGIRLAKVIDCESDAPEEHRFICWGWVKAKPLDGWRFLKRG